ncbi:hypothetical protein F4818DRAFT_441664 [Hypoxylon cercidicola]|nr:hypothetical protein F4818DRAFT_441664 [Hypoxylon cercidicola]
MASQGAVTTGLSTQPSVQPQQPQMSTATAVPNAANAAAPAAGHPQGQNTTIAHPGATGHIDDSGKFRCACGARPIKNTAHHISSHLSHKHRPNSTDAQKRARNPRICGLCQKECGSFFIFESHIRQIHKFRGTSAAYWGFWKETAPGDTITVRGHKVRSG